MLSLISLMEVWVDKSRSPSRFWNQWESFAKTFAPRGKHVLNPGQSDLICHKKSWPWIRIKGLRPATVINIRIWNIWDLRNLTESLDPNSISCVWLLARGWSEATIKLELAPLTSHNAVKGGPDPFVIHTSRIGLDRLRRKQFVGMLIGRM